MAEHEFLALLSEKVLDGADIKMDDTLKEIEEWDSLSIVAFLAMINIAIDKSINPLDARKALTVRDLYELTV